MTEEMNSTFVNKRYHINTREGKQWWREKLATKELTYSKLKVFLINSEVAGPALTHIYIVFVDMTDHHPVIWQLIGFLVLTSLAFGL